MENIKFSVSEKDYLDYKKKKIARTLVTKAIANGELIRATECHICKKETKTHAHHVDYGKPMEIVWVCTGCHGLCHTADHMLNPKNNPQTIIPYIWDSRDTVTVSFNIPAKIFIAIKIQSKSSEKSVSEILRDHIKEIYPIETNQLEFNFNRVAHDNTQPEQLKNVQSLGENENILQKPKLASFQVIRTEGNIGVQGMGGKFFKISRRDGGDSGQLQWDIQTRQLQGVL